MGKGDPIAINNVSAGLGRASTIVIHVNSKFSADPSTQAKTSPSSIISNHHHWHTSETILKQQLISDQNVINDPTDFHFNNVEWI